MTRALALRLLRHYPLAWRERYEAEVSALIDDGGVRVRDVAELGRGMVIERIRELLTSTEDPRKTALVLGLVKPIAAVLFLGIAIATGLIVRGFIGPWSDDARQWGAAAFVWFFALGMTLGLLTRRRPWVYGAPPYPAWVAVVVLPCLFVLLVLAVAGEFSMSDQYSSSGMKWITRNEHWLNLIIYGGWLFDLSGGLWPGRKLLQALLELQVAEHQLKSGEVWAESCREWIAKGVPSPLADAERQIAEARDRLAIANERLRAMGYRARFALSDGNGAIA